MAIIALSAAITPFVGQNFGARKYDRVSSGVLWCYKFSIVYGLSVAACIILLSPFIAGVFTDDPTAITTAKLHMRIVPISYLALGFAMTANSSFNAIGKPMPAMFISMTRTILCYAPLAFLFARWFGLIGIFAAACTANFIAGTLGVVWFRAVFKHKVEDQKPALQPTS
jgi:Na+-driven multidrug efflux pump